MERRLKGMRGVEGALRIEIRPIRGNLPRLGTPSDSIFKQVSMFPPSAFAPFLGTIAVCRKPSSL